MTSPSPCKSHSGGDGGGGGGVTVSVDGANEWSNLGGGAGPGFDDNDDAQSGGVIIEM